MIFFPHCKINLGLRILRKRADGYHDLETIFYPLPALRDALEIIPSDSLSLHVTGADIPGDPASNLCLKAHELLARDFPSIQPVEIHLHKHIPTGAGLGGGSADGAFALRGLNQLFHLGLNREQLLPYAAALGSDCPFFLYDSPCVASGRGEILKPLELDLSAYRLALINPGIHVDTGWAFGQLSSPTTPREEAASLSGGAPDRGVVPDVIEWKNFLVNDFEVPVFRKYPEIKRIKDHLYEMGAV